MSQPRHISPHSSGADRSLLLYRELAHREAHGLSVRLFWSPCDDEVFVHVQAEHDDFVFNPDKSEALFAYHHPYIAANQALEGGRIAA